MIDFFANTLVYIAPDCYYHCDIVIRRTNYWSFWYVLRVRINWYKYQLRYLPSFMCLSKSHIAPPTFMHYVSYDTVLCKEAPFQGFTQSSSPNSLKFRRISTGLGTFCNRNSMCKLETLYIKTSYGDLKGNPTWKIDSTWFPICHVNTNCLKRKFSFLVGKCLTGKTPKTSKQ
jgi:hypothetical protein